jgi:site-specific recombinase XerD
MILKILSVSISFLCRAVSLEWSNVSLTRKIASLIKTKPGKTRHIPLNAVAMDAFRQLWIAQEKPTTDPVFLNTDRNQLRSARDWFEPAVAEAKLHDYTWHCNRHTFASRLVMAGVDIRTVAYLMGHSTIQMTMRYAHLAPEHNREAVDRLILSEALVTKSATDKREKAARKSK